MVSVFLASRAKLMAIQSKARISIGLFHANEKELRMMLLIRLSGMYESLTAERLNKFTKSLLMIDSTERNGLEDVQ